MSDSFDHFPEETRQFLLGIAANNEKAWFDENRALYDAVYVGAAKQFVEIMAPRLREISPDVHAEPRINGSIMRINRDVRFSKDKRPYKSNLGIWFWHGEKRSLVNPGFYVSIAPDQVFIGCGMYQFDKETLDSFRHAIVLPRSGKALVEAVATVRAAGDYEIGQKTRKRPPRGFETDAERADFLLFEGLTGSITLPGNAAFQPGFAKACLTHCAATWPIGRWLLAEL